MDVREEIKQKEKKRKKEKAAIGISLVLIGAAVALLLWPQSVDPPQSYANASSDTVHESNVEASKVFNVTSLGVTPVSHRIEVEEAVGFRNQLEKKVEISFDRSNDTIELEPEETVSVYINAITYFDVSGEDYSASARVNVQ